MSNALPPIAPEPASTDSRLSAAVHGSLSEKCPHCGAAASHVTKRRVIFECHTLRYANGRIKNRTPDCYECEIAALKGRVGIHAANADWNARIVDELRRERDGLQADLCEIAVCGVGHPSREEAKKTPESPAAAGCRDAASGSEVHLERRQRMAGLLYQCRGEVRGVQQIAHADNDSQTMMWASHVGRTLDDLRALLLQDATHPWPPNTQAVARSEAELPPAPCSLPKS